MTRHQAEIGGQVIAWYEAGSGRPVVLLHAFPMDARMWQPQLNVVPAGWRFIAPDLPGFGGSAGAPATSVDEYAAAVRALLGHLTIDDAVIGGLSMGGYVTLALYRQAPEIFRAMILADTRAEADSADVRAGRDKMQIAVRERGAVAAADAMQPKLLGSRTSDPALVARVRDVVLEIEPATILAALDALKTRPDSTPLLSRITCPTLIIAGADDEVTPVALAEAMEREIGGAELVVVPDAAHLSNLIQPDTFNLALRSFLARL